MVLSRSWGGMIGNRTRLGSMWLRSSVTGRTEISNRRCVFSFFPSAPLVMATHLPPLQLSLSIKAKDDEDVELALPNNVPTVPMLWGIPLKYLSYVAIFFHLRVLVTDSMMGRLVTLAVQNSALTIIMHYSRVSTPASRTYSAATAVLMNEILKGLISLMIAFCRVDTSTMSYELAQASYSQGQASMSQTLRFRSRKLAREVLSPDCWKLSIPAILYGVFLLLFFNKLEMTPICSHSK